MDNKKLAELAKDKEFMQKMVNSSTKDEVKKLFRERGIEITDSDLDFLGKVIAQSVASNGKLSEEKLENIAGGLSGADIAFGTALAVGASAATVAGTGALAWWTFLTFLEGMTR